MFRLVHVAVRICFTPNAKISPVLSDKITKMRSNWVKNSKSCGLRVRKEAFGRWISFITSFIKFNCSEDMQSNWLGVSLSNQVLHLPVVVGNKASNLMVSNLMVSKNALMCRPLKTELELQWPEAIFKTRTTIEFREFSRRLSHTLQIYPGLSRRKTARFSKGVNSPSSLGLEWRYSNVFSDLSASLGLAGIPTEVAWGLPSDSFKGASRWRTETVVKSDDTDDMTNEVCHKKPAQQKFNSANLSALLGF